MILKIYNLIKKVVFSGFILYGYNVLAAPLSIVIPINFVTIGTISILGFPALFAFIIIHVLIF